VTQQEHFEEMARRRPHTVLRCLEGGHVVHQDTPEGFAGAVREFLEGLGK
jgi:pimeloyl-ACP methyl ester carboxylesterase